MRHLILILMIICSSLARADAQTGLAIERFFDDGLTHAPGADVTAVDITGSKLKAYDLSIYRSVSVTDDESLTAKIERAVAHDGAKALSREVSLKSGRLYFGFYILPSVNHENRFIFYLNSTLSGGKKVILIYMQGKASQQQIQKMLDQK